MKNRECIELLCQKLNLKAVGFGSAITLSQVNEAFTDVPKVINDYVLKCMPSRDIDYEGLTILGASDFVEKNLDYSPAIFIRDIGFWTIATFYDGSAFVVDVETNKILIVDPGNFFYKDGIPTAISMKGNEPISRKFVLEKSELHADDLSDFFCGIIDQLE